MPSFKIIQSGHILEIYEYQASIGMKRDDNIIYGNGGDGQQEKEDRGDRTMESRATQNQLARNKIRRLINANFDRNGKFITLTFAENMQDVAYGNKCFQDFMKRMKRRQKDFKHVTVIEFQKRGAVHYHMLCNYDIEWISMDELREHERALAEIWGHGFVDIGFKETDNVGAYLIKYMTKDNHDERLTGKKRYFFSRNLIQPREIVGQEAFEIVKEYEDLPPVFTNEYYSDFHGKVSYREFNPERTDLNAYKEKIEDERQKVIDEAKRRFGADFVEVEE